MITDIAIEMLTKNFLLNVDMLECIRRGSVEILFASNEGVLIKDCPSNIYMLSSNNIEVSKSLINILPEDFNIVSTHDKFSFDLLLEKHIFSETMACYNTVYTKKTPIVYEKSSVEIKPLTLQYKDNIINSYSKMDIIDSNYIENRLKANVMFGAFIDNNLCGFIGSHEEGSIGMLEVLPKFKGKGIGSSLQIAATNHALALKRYPYGQVVETNIASTALQKKLGFELSKDKVYWLIR
ncbi:GNAT family N-acetyltransferase [Clostridium sp. C2-6-12]|uniref:GNAT family N-acetyltransferase n=1 Tax=Clostridium sp. C2-6-12 TaxID=2698832 RepID=UPI00136C2CCC|nr:GNAT family N-acetyltransferase [Clostridium sp. C2-6-12]